MDFASLATALQIIGPALAAWVAVQVGVKEALLRASQAQATADKAHDRIDSIMERAKA